MPDIFIQSPIEGICWICRIAPVSSREHKIKASDLRRHFGRSGLYVSVSGDENSKGKYAQGVNSSHLKFGSTICEQCNSDITQESDQSYDRFIRQIEDSDFYAEEIYKIFSYARFCQGFQLRPYIPLYRYFAKLLGCQLADIGAPIPLHLSRFVAKQTEKNCIWLGVRRDVTYSQMQLNLPNERLSYAAHGGLVVITKLPKFLPSRLYTTLTVGPVQFTFFFVLKKFHIWEMRLRHPQFVSWCKDMAQNAMHSPVLSSQLDRLGLYRQNEE